MEKSQHPKPEIIGAEMFAYEKPGLKVLPYTNNRYALAKDDFRLIDRLSDKEIVPDFTGRFNIPDSIYGTLDSEELWMLTHKPLNLDLVDFMSTFPSWEKIEIVSKPDTKIHGSTRFWKFSKIESRTFKDHFYIPGFTNYVISEKGNIVSLYTGTKLSTHVSKTGYPSVRLVRDDRSEVIMTLHRLLVSVFKDWGSDADTLHVDHLDGDKLNHSLENLDLVSQKTNIRRAVESNFYRPEELKEYFLRDFKTEETATFMIIADLARYIGVNDATVKYHLNKELNTSLIKGRFFVAKRLKNSKGQYIDGFTGDLGTNWFTDMDKFNLRVGSQPRAVLVKNVITQLVEPFPSVVKMLESTGLSRKQVYGNLKASVQKRYGDIVFKYEDDISEWLI